MSLMVYAQTAMASAAPRTRKTDEPAAARAKHRVVR